ncbi:MAG TPA: hypothetical protein VGJ88_10430 [Thermoanaerobaculia bacterium]
MKRAALLPLLLFAAYCTSGAGGMHRSGARSGHGAITVQVAPNPIVAQPVSGNVYDFPFDVIVRETGGHSVTITSVTADVTAMGGLRVAQDSYDAAKINSLGYSTTLPANGELRYHFAPRRSVPDERLFSGVTAELTVYATADTGTATSAKTTVTVSR